MALSRSLQHDTFSDAKDVFGTPINAFMAIKGWNIDRLMVAILASLIGSVAIAAVTAAVSRSFATGLTAGSYTGSLLSLGLATVMLLSSVL